MNYSMKTFMQSPTFEVVFLRHAQTQWNSLNLFSGWYDSKLTGLGKIQAERAGKLLKREQKCFDLVYTSELGRTKQTLGIVLDKLKQCPKVVSSWKLNEQHTGGLTGLSRDEVVETVGEEQVNKWRFDLEEKLPPMNKDHELFYNICCKSSITPPPFESLNDLMKRVLDFWTYTIVPEIRKSSKVLIVGHHSAFKVLFKNIDPAMPKNLGKIKIPHCQPFTYTFNFHMQPIRSKKAMFLGNSVSEIEKSREGFYGEERIINKCRL